MIVPTSLVLTALATSVNGYWLMGVEDFITTERIDPVVTPGKVASHVHSVLGGSNFRMTTNTSSLRQSTCTSIPIPQDKSAYWFPHLYFHWANGNFTSLDGGAVICTPKVNLEAILSLIIVSPTDYLFSDKAGTTTAFPDDFRMISGNAALRTYNSTSFAQQAITFLCLDFNGKSTRHNELPAKLCPDGIRAQINFPSCWDGKNTDSADHKSHVAFPSGGPDSGTCSDPKYPKTVPRIFMEVYWGSPAFDNVRNQAKNPSQPFVYSNGDPTGYGYHADFINGWESGVLQNAVNKCNCNPYGDPTCCVDQGIFSMNSGKTCRITKNVDETTTGTLTKLPGNNPVVSQGVATPQADPVTPALLGPIYAYEGDKPTATGKVVSAAVTSKPVATSTAAVAPVATAPPPSSKPLADSKAPVSKSVATPAAPTVKTVPAATQTAVAATPVSQAGRSILDATVVGPANKDEAEVVNTGAAEEANHAAAAADSKEHAQCSDSSSNSKPMQKDRLVKVRRGHNHHRQPFSHHNAHGSFGL